MSCSSHESDRKTRRANTTPPVFLTIEEVIAGTGLRRDEAEHALEELIRKGILIVAGTGEHRVIRIDLDVCEAIVRASETEDLRSTVARRSRRIRRPAGWAPKDGRQLRRPSMKDRVNPERN
jgi:hypothetical protein